MLPRFVYFRVIKCQNVPLMKCKESSILFVAALDTVQSRYWKMCLAGCFYTFGGFSSVLLHMHVFLLIRITFGGHGKFTLQQLVANYWQIYASCCWVGIPVLRCGSGAESRFLPINVAASHSDLKSVAEAGGLRDRRLLVTINNMLSAYWTF